LYPPLGHSFKGGCRKSLWSGHIITLFDIVGPAKNFSKIHVTKGWQPVTSFSHIWWTLSWVMVS